MSQWIQRAALLTAAVFGLGGCASPGMKATTMPATLASLQPHQESPNARRAAGKRSHDVLALSSGGADGAFGAGVLVGWSESGQRPEFDVVTGVSTGALQAPLAFLGARYDPLLAELFTSTSTRDVFKGNGIGSLIKSGLNDSAPLERLLDRVLSENLLAAIASEHARGRRLYVTTTDLSLGRSVIWDMGALAASGRSDARATFIRILVASAAPPGFVEPIVLPDPANGEPRLHGDGGIKRAIAVEPSMLRGPGSRKLHVIANGHVSTVAVDRLEGLGAAAIARRGVSLLLRNLIYSATERAEAMARYEKAVFRLQRIPDALPEARKPFAFDPAEMRVLFEAGRAQGRDPRSWLVATPRPGA